MRLSLFLFGKIRAILRSVEISPGTVMVVLIVEDNPAMRRIIRTFIGDLADIVEAPDLADASAAALEAYERSRPDWVLMDIRLGPVNGIEASREIKMRHAEARIVIVTDYDDIELREAAVAAGACDYVLKENLVELRGILLGASTRDPFKLGRAEFDG